MKLSDGVLVWLNYKIPGLHILGVQCYLLVTLILFLRHGEE